MKKQLQIILPEELEKDFSFEEVLLVKKNSILCTLKKNIPFPEASYILKIIPKKQYNKAIYEKLTCLPESGILTAVQEYHTKHFIYFIFPKLQSLSYLVKAGKMDFHNIKRLITDIGATILSLHKEHIFHMDIAPGNIYQSEDGHFLLGDFSSACIFPDMKKHSLFSCFRNHPTGSTKGFYPENISPDSSPAGYDLYGFFMILFLLLNHGKCPFEKNIKKNTAFFHSNNFPISETEEEPFRKVNSFLKNTLLECSTESLSPSVFEKCFFTLKNIFNEVKEQKIRNSFRTEISDDENCLFCSFTEPEEKGGSAIFPFKIPSESFSFEKKQNNPTIPKSLFSKEKLNKSALYGLLTVCVFLFLFACYHSIPTDTGKQSIREPKIEIISAETPNSSSDISPEISVENSVENSIENSVENSMENSVETSGSFHTFLPSKTKQKISLDLSGRNLQNTSFLSKVPDPDKITIIFAQKNNFSGIHAFLSFSNIKELYLSQNPITSVQGIRELKHLEILDLSGNHLQDISALCSLKHLKILDLCGQTHLKSIQGLKNIKSLEYLILTDSNVNEKEISDLKKHLPACSILF